MARRNKKKILKRWHIAVFSAALILVLLLAVRHTSVPDEPKSITIEGITYSNGVTLTLKNTEDMAAECLAVFGQEKYPLGTLGAGKSKDVHVNADGNLDRIDCTWKNMDVTGCEDTSFDLCPYKDDPKLAECMSYDIPYQHFCAALIKKNSSLCKNIYTEPRMTHCFAYIDKKPELCSTLKVGQDWCYQDYAMNTGRAELCGMIADKVRADSCMSVVTGDLELCKSLKNNADCLLHFVEASGDSSLCDFSDNPENCYANIYH